MAILQEFGFEVARIRGSHHMLQRIRDETTQTIAVPVHKNKPLAIGTLKSIYRQTANYVSEIEVKQAFYADYSPDETTEDEADNTDDSQ